MSPKKHRCTLVALACLAVAAASAHAEPATRSLRFDISSQSLAQALRTWEVRVEVVDISQELRDEILAAQRTQTMVNPDVSGRPGDA